jgi:hypothetical protein
MHDEHSVLWRRTILFGVPFLYLILGLLHPPANPARGDDPDLVFGLHIAQLFLISGLGYLLWLLVDGLDARGATLTRALIIPFVVAYTALDSVLGIAWGIVVEKTNQLPDADQPAAGRLIDDLLAPEPLGLILYWGAGALWLAVALAAVTTLRGAAPRGALALVTIGSIAFTVGHVRPVGPIGMGLILAGLVWMELWPRDVAAARRADSMQEA